MLELLRTKFSLPVLFGWWDVNLALNNEDHSFHPTEQMRSSQKMMRDRKIPNIIEHLDPAVPEADTLYFSITEANTFLLLSPPSKFKLGFYCLEPRILNSTRGFRLGLRQLPFHLSLHILT